MTYRVLGVDQSMRHTGWAYYQKGAAQPASGVHELPNWGDEEGRYAFEWWSWLTDFCRRRSITHLFYEGLPGNAKFTDHSFESLNETLAQKGLFLLCDMAGAALSIPSRVVPINAWRARFIGTAVAPPSMKGARKHIRTKWWKDEALRACRDRGWPVYDHNAAEAMGIMDFGVCSIDPLYASSTDPIFRRREAHQDRQRVVA